MEEILSLLDQLEQMMRQHHNDRPEYGLDQCLQAIQNEKVRIENHKQTPELKARALYQQLSSLSLFKKVPFTAEEKLLLEAIKQFA
ncbi:MAG: hypothetical protein Q4A55_05275 [Aerococcus sp.]|nr:hypothetical protein [Aerococcus sp.]